MSAIVVFGGIGYTGGNVVREAASRVTRSSPLVGSRTPAPPATPLGLGTWKRHCHQAIRACKGVSEHP